jgi:hypothetical protein
MGQRGRPPLSQPSSQRTGAREQGRHTETSSLMATDILNAVYGSPVRCLGVPKEERLESSLPDRNITIGVHLRS